MGNILQPSCAPINLLKRKHIALEKNSHETFFLLQIQSQRTFPVYLCKKGAALCWQRQSAIHKTLQLTYLTSVTCPLESRASLTVTATTVHPLWLQIYPTSERCILTGRPPCINVWKQKDTSTHTLVTHSWGCKLSKPKAADQSSQS